MKGISLTEHNRTIKFTERYKQLYERYGNNIVSEEKDNTIRENTAELEGFYDYYLILFEELEKCIKHYHLKRKVLKTNLYSSIRKMETLKNKG
ncbi:hypothetical protein [Flavobacterium sp. U410]|jgi:hypothetical protein